MLGGLPHRWVTFFFLLESSQVGVVMEYAFEPNILDIFSPDPNKALQK
jgi:hypothetical protein